jgi:hypothetical protein
MTKPLGSKSWDHKHPDSKLAWSVTEILPIGPNGTNNLSTFFFPLNTDANIYWLASTEYPSNSQWSTSWSLSIHLSNLVIYLSWCYSFCFGMMQSSSHTWSPRAHITFHLMEWNLKSQEVRIISSGVHTCQWTRYTILCIYKNWLVIGQDS